MICNTRIQRGKFRRSSADGDRDGRDGDGDGGGDGGGGRVQPIILQSQSIKATPAPAAQSCCHHLITAATLHLRIFIEALKIAVNFKSQKVSLFECDKSRFNE